MEDKKSARLTAKSKIWVELDDEVVFGLGRIRLFEAIDKTGSISKAAVELGMSYRAAWGKIKATEERLQINLVDRQQGNRNTSLTPIGRELLSNYKQFKKEAQQSVDDLFEVYLGNSLNHLREANIAKKSEKE